MGCGAFWKASADTSTSATVLVEVDWRPETASGSRMNRPCHRPGGPTIGGNPSGIKGMRLCPIVEALVEVALADRNLDNAHPIAAEPSMRGQP